MPHSSNKNRHLFEFPFQGVLKPHVTFLITGLRTPGGPKTCRKASLRGALLGPCLVRGRPRSGTFTSEGTPTPGCHSGADSIVPVAVAGCRPRDLGVNRIYGPALAGLCFIIGCLPRGILLNPNPGFVAPSLPFGAAWWPVAKRANSQWLLRS